MLESSDAGKRQEENSVSKQEGTGLEALKHSLERTNAPDLIAKRQADQAANEALREELLAAGPDECKRRLAAISSDDYRVKTHNMQLLIESVLKTFGDGQESEDEFERWDMEASAAAKSAVEKSQVARVVGAEANERAIAQIRRENSDVVRLAGLLFRNRTIQYPDTKYVKSGDSFVQQAQMTDQNKNTVLDALFGFDRKKIKERCKADPDEVANLMDGLTFKKPAADESRPHRDMFKGRIVDHTGEIIDDHYPVSAWIETFSAAGLKGVSAKAAREVLKEWALEHKWNNLIERLNETIPEWDGKPRMETKLIEMFQTHDTPLNKSFGKYFWLSLYGRVMYPGIYAPMVLSLFGAQDCGKSYFGKRLSQIILGNEGADSVQLNLDGDKMDFLREITGTSVIASVGEMTGFTRGDLNKIKDFITRTSDPMHYKYEGQFEQQRQFIIVMDGNKYEGLQRDDTGNRRLYPMFCGQMEDEDGQPRWRDDFSAAFESEERGISFTADVWQLLAEAREWFNANSKDGYVTFVREVSRQVAEFSRKERAADRGTVHDPDVDTFIYDALLGCPKRLYTERKGDNRQGVLIDKADLILAFKKASQINNPNMKHIETKVISLGSEYGAFAGNRRGYFFAGHLSIDAMTAALKGDEGLSDKVAGEKREEPF